MYFIPRNNKFYNYIAHTDLKRCYAATFFCVIIFFVIGLYGIYYPLLAHILLLKTERTSLQKKSDEIEYLDKSKQALSKVVEVNKKYITDHAIVSDKRDEYCHKRMLFVLENITQTGLTLNSYGSCKEQDKDWYIKNSAHFDVAGTMKNLMLFLEKMKSAGSMTSITQTNLTRVTGDMFQMSFDAGFITVK